ncbi:Alpha/Beta hydrolase protein, partial [Umbelopsis sp. PMI_123]
CVINQRLAPQHPFPAPLEDVLATYLQLIDKENSDCVDPKNLIVAGESHGGGMVMALLLLLRDRNLPLPAGAIGLSPWVDLTHSLPSILTNISTDYLPASGFSHKHSKALEFNNLPQFEPETLGPLGKAVRQSMSNEDLDRVHLYAPNATLKMRYVSPIFDEQELHGLPPLLIQVGTAERLRDESIYSAYKASNEYPGSSSPHFTASPTKVKLELYVDQPHVFQMILATKQRTVAFNRIGEFVKSIT